MADVGDQRFIKSVLLYPNLLKIIRNFRYRLFMLIELKGIRSQRLSVISFCESVS